MIKKILSIFMAFAFLFSPVSVIASGARGKMPRPRKLSAIRAEKIIAQKAFLTALLCLLDTDVIIKFHQDNRHKALNFTILQIGNSMIESRDLKDNLPQIKALLEFLNFKQNIIDFKCDVNPALPKILSGVKVNQLYLTQKVIKTLGEKILTLIYQKKRGSTLGIINLKQDNDFMREVKQIMGNLLQHKPFIVENSLNFYTPLSKSCTKRIEPIKNYNHVSYIKAHPEKSSIIEFCYQKACLIGFLFLGGADITLQEYHKNTRSGFIDIFNLSKINEISAKHKEGKPYERYCNNLIRISNSIFPPEKLKIEKVTKSNLTPEKIIIGGTIILDETDILNLGQRFYNYAYKAMLDFVRYYPNTLLTKLEEIPDFAENLKNEFEKYTGKKLPNLK